MDFNKIKKHAERGNPLTRLPISAMAAAFTSLAFYGCSSVGNDDTLSTFSEGATGEPGTTEPVGFEPRINPIDLVRFDAPELAALGDYETGVTTLTFVNENQLDVVNATEQNGIPTKDRALTVEVWYPAEAVSDEFADRTSTAITRDPETVAILRGSAARDATPLVAENPFPLILLSHGFPGNRYLMSHFGENLATKGFVVASIDHTDSTYSDKSAFISTLLNRSLDQNYVLQEMARLSQTDGGAFSGIINTDEAGIIGYSMGAYGAINTVGGGLSDAVTSFTVGTPIQVDALSQRQLSNPGYQSTVDPRFKAVIAIGPWGNQNGFWDAAGLANIDIPVMVIAGDMDNVSDYHNGIEPLFRELSGIDKYFLTFENGSHNTAAPIPAPQEVFATGERFDHYADAVWDNTRMNNIAQHFATAFFEQYLKGEDREAYFDLIPVAQDGDEEAGTTWKGFRQRDAVGLKFEFELQ